jgi:SAM-dependent methyltransferase
MPDQLDQRYLKFEQYKDASHLNARIQLHQRFSTNPYGWFKWVFDQLLLPPATHILEIGCGPGTLWLENQNRIPSGWHITLSDFSPGMVREARSNISSNLNRFTYAGSDGMAIPFPKETFGAVIANHILYHFTDRKKALAEISRVLKPEGIFFASTIGENHLMELSQIMADFTPTGGNYFSPALNPCGFTLENGTHQLTPWFDPIEIHHYPDSLVITETEPLVAYILSMVSGSKSTKVTSEINRLNRLLDKMIKQCGSIYIQKSSGIFIGIKKGMDNG